MTPFQDRLLRVLRRCPKRTGLVSRIAGMIRTSNVAVISSARALERAGVVNVFNVFPGDGDGVAAGLYLAMRSRPAQGDKS